MNASLRDYTFAEETSRLAWTTGVVDFDIFIDAGAQLAARPAIEFLSAVFRSRPSGSQADIVFHLRDFADFDERLSVLATAPFVLRRSSARPFNLDLLLGQAKDGRIVAFDPATRTAYIADPGKGYLTLCISVDSTYHVIETLRYTLLAAEQSRGTLILHASAAQTADGPLVLVLGEKGRGKTTTLLKLILEEGLTYFSGDKVLADTSTGALRLRAWPDYAHIGLGTLGAFPDFAKACGVSLTDQTGRPRDPEEKVLVCPARYLAALGKGGDSVVSQLSHILLPDIKAPNAPPTLLTSASARRSCLESIVEDARVFTPGCWHKLLDCGPPSPVDRIAHAFDAAEWRYVPGAPRRLADYLGSRSA